MFKCEEYAEMMIVFLILILFLYFSNKAIVSSNIAANTAFPISPVLPLTFLITLIKKIVDDCMIKNKN